LKVGPWLSAYFCALCDGEMSWGAMMDSPAGHGRCPHCGQKHKDACTIVECKERGYRWVYGGPFNLFRKKREWAA
jgi:DNA-directed RNA polymerase subunit RPC12/RpoP